MPDMYFTTGLYMDAAFLLTDENGVFDYDTYDEMFDNDLGLDVINDSMGEHKWCYVGFSFINADPYEDTDAKVNLGLVDFVNVFIDVRKRLDELFKQYNIDYVILPSDIKFISMVRLC